MIGTMLQGRYRIDGLLGTGAFATVHLGYDQQLEDPVAVKMLAENHAVNPDMRDRFVAEGQVLRRVDSPHVVRVHDLALSDDGRPFLVLQLCDRGSLADRVEQAWASGWLASEADLAAIAVPLADAVLALADADLVHRDLTPANILFTTTPPDSRPDLPTNLVAPDERLVVTDLGLCKDLAVGTGLTVAGGTEGFRAPEQRTPGGTVEPRTDVWAASAVLVWMATGVTHDGPVTAAVALTAAGMSAAMVEVITAGLQPHPSQRPHPAEWATTIIAAAPRGKQPSRGSLARLTGRVRRRLAGRRLPRPLGRLGQIAITLVVAVMVLWVLTIALQWGDAMLARRLADGTQQSSHDPPAGHGSQIAQVAPSPLGAIVAPPSASLEPAPSRRLG